MNCYVIFSSACETKTSKTYLSPISIAFLQVQILFRWFDLRRNYLKAFYHPPLQVLKQCFESQPHGSNTNSCSPALLVRFRPFIVQIAQLLAPTLDLSPSRLLCQSLYRSSFFWGFSWRNGGLVFNCIILFKKNLMKTKPCWTVQSHQWFLLHFKLQTRKPARQNRSFSKRRSCHRVQWENFKHTGLTDAFFIFPPETVNGTFRYVLEPP